MCVCVCVCACVHVRVCAYVHVVPWSTLRHTLANVSMHHGTCRSCPPFLKALDRPTGRQSRLVRFASQPLTPLAHSHNPRPRYHVGRGEGEGGGGAGVLGCRYVVEAICDVCTSVCVTVVPEYIVCRRVMHILSSHRTATVYTCTYMAISVKRALFLWHPLP